MGVNYKRPHLLSICSSMELTSKDVHQALAAILAEWYEMGVLLSQDDRERVLRVEYDRLVGSLKPDALS